MANGTKLVKFGEKTLRVPSDASPDEIDQLFKGFETNIGLAPAAGAPTGKLPPEIKQSDLPFSVKTAPGQILGRISESMESMAALPTQFIQETRRRVKEAPTAGAAALAVPQTEAETLKGMGKGVLSVTTPGLAYRLLKKERPANIIGDVALFLAGTPEGRAAGPGPFKRAAMPREVPIAGEKVPVLVGEAAPETRMGRFQTELKRAGAGEQQFKDFTAKQQAKVKQVIRNVAQQTSGTVGPMPGEPAEALGTAAETTFSKARPMYNALDDALVTVPDSMSNVSAVTKQAIARAKKLGVEVTEGGGESVTINGRTFTPQTDPVAWQTLQQQGLVPKTTGQPLTTYMKVRSELLKMQRMTKDAAVKYAIGNELRGMNDNMDAALKGTPLYDQWKEASRLWAKGYALREVADAFRETTKGTPEAQQAPGLSTVPTRIQGPQLVKRLNTLEHSGVLKQAFNLEEAKNIRQAADILDRGAMKAGREFGFGYTVHSTIMRNLVKLPGYNIVKVMTSTEGISALNAAEAARTPAELQTAMAKIAALAGVSAAVGNRKEALERLGR